MVFWAYNLGIGNMQSAINEYVKTSGGKNVNVIGLLTSKAVRKRLRDNYIDVRTFDYLPQIVAADILLGELRVA